MQEHEKYEEEEKDSKGEQKGGPNRMGKKKTSQRERPRDKQTQQADQEMGRKDIPFSRHHGDDPDLEDGDHGSGLASAANGCLSASYPLKARTMSPYRTLGNDLI